MTGHPFPTHRIHPQMTTCNITSRHDQLYPIRGLGRRELVIYNYQKLLYFLDVLNLYHKLIEIFIIFRLTKERFCLPLLPLGGILADEMGLGKTVEVIACILCHRKPSAEQKSLDNTMTPDQCSNVNQTDTTTPLASIQECSKLNHTECDISTHKGTISNANKQDSVCDTIDNDSTDASSSQVSTCSKTMLTSCDGSGERDTETVTGESDSSLSAHSTMTCNHELNNLVTAVQSDQENAASSAITTSIEEISATKCQCICGTNVASCDDKLLQCCGCQAVFHAKCLRYDCSGEFLCPHCAVNQVRTLF